MKRIFLIIACLFLFSGMATAQTVEITAINLMPTVLLQNMGEIHTYEDTVFGTDIDTLDLTFGDSVLYDGSIWPELAAMVRVCYFDSISGGGLLKFNFPGDTAWSTLTIGTKFNCANALQDSMFLKGASATDTLIYQLVYTNIQLIIR